MSLQPPVYEDYALLKVLFSLRMANKKRYPVHSFSYKELSVTQIFSGYQFPLQHGRQTQVSSATIGKYQVTKAGWRLVTTDDLTQQPVRKPASYLEAVESLRQLKKQDPTKAAELKILRLSELKKVEQ